MIRVHLVTVHAGTRLGSCSHVRLLLPLAHPTLGGRFVTTHSTDYAPADVVIVERAWTADHGHARDLVRRVRAAGACLIYATDDNILDLEVTGPVGRWLSDAHKEVIRFVASEADGVIVSTEPLRRQMVELNARVVVVPNALDERLARSGTGGDTEAAGTRGGRAGGPCVIGYMGTATHDADLAMVAPALCRTLRRHAGAVEFQLVGAVADPAALRPFAGLPVTVLRTGDAVEYPAFMRWMAERVRWDLAIAPLADDPFTRCKSDIKLLDYAAIGTAGVFSRVGPYRETVRHLETGYLTANDPAAWEDALELLVRDPDLRQRLAGGARRYLFAERTLTRRAHEWEAAIQCIREASDSTRTPRRAGVAAEAAVPTTADDPLDRRVAHGDLGRTSGLRRGGTTADALVVVPGSVNYFYNRAGERLADALRDLGLTADVRRFYPAREPPSADRGRYEWCFIVNPAELVASCGDKSAALRRIARLQERCRRTTAVAMEAVGTSWFSACVDLCREAGVPTLLDLGFHDQFGALSSEARPLYRFCLNGLTGRERAAVPADPRPNDRPIPWVLVGHLSTGRSALALRLVREAAAGGFVYLPHLSPVTESGPHLNERQFQAVLARARCQVWCSHHGGFYMESERFRDSLLTGSLPVKVVGVQPDGRRVLPFEHLVVGEVAAPGRIRAVGETFATAWRRFADEFLALPPLEHGLAAFLDDERPRVLVPKAEIGTTGTAPASARPNGGVESRKAVAV